MEKRGAIGTQTLEFKCLFMHVLLTLLPILPSIIEKWIINKKIEEKKTIN